MSLDITSSSEANEADVREEVAAPFLSALGYKRGTENDILREYSLSYGRNFLGRKKENDPPLRGRADYILSILGAGRWILETKAATQEISIDDIEQAITYARHPEVSASYAAILNGKRIVVMHVSQKSNESPLVDEQITSPQILAEKLSGLLSPLAIRRDCSPPIVDLGLPIVNGYRSRIDITGGKITHIGASWDCNISLGAEAEAIFDSTCSMMKGFQSAITGGSVFRDDQSRVIATLSWSMPHADLLQFANDKGLMETKYVCLDNKISDDPDHPAVFDVIGDVKIDAGEHIFNIVNWQSSQAEVDMQMRYRGQAVGNFLDGAFRGQATSEYEITYPKVPELKVNMYTVSEIEVILSNK